MSLRRQMASASVLVATLICASEHHIHIVLRDPGTYTSPLHHRCGVLLIGCVVWLAGEYAWTVRCPRRAA